MRATGAVLGRKFKGQGITLDNWKRFVLEVEENSQVRMIDSRVRVEVNATEKIS